MKNSIDGVTVWAVYISPGPFSRLINGQDGELDVSRFVSCVILHRTADICSMTALLLIRGFEM